MKAIDLTGLKAGRLTVLEFSYSLKMGDGRTYRYWLCICDCGKMVRHSAGNLKSQHIQSCGCLQKERAAEANTLHGKTRTPEFNVWVKMRQRCTNPKSKDYANYGGRGIYVCDRWNDFSLFLKDMGTRPTMNHTIERIHNELGYSPNNCCWATRKQQNSNTRQNRFLTLNGVTLTTTQWAERLGVQDTILHKRIYLGWSAERTLTQPIRRRQ